EEFVYWSPTIRRNGSPSSRTVTLPGSGRVWPTVRDNNATPGRCGVDMALVVDLSNSVTEATWSRPSLLPQYKAAATEFVDALSGTPSRIAVHTFATNAPANDVPNAGLPLTSVATSTGAIAVRNKISALQETANDDH